MDMSNLEIEDVAGASLTLLGSVVESYIKEGYCDPLLYRALQGAEELTRRFKDIAIENDQNGLAIQLDELLVNIQVTAIEAGQVIEDIINEHGLAVDPRTFERTDKDGE